MEAGALLPKKEKARVTPCFCLELAVRGTIEIFREREQ